jgi:hypothetical protein
LVSSERAAFAARGKVSFYDSVNHTEWNTLKRREGVVVAADRTFMAPVGGLREKCKTCEVSGSTITPGNPGCNC